jgi:hypothetical protein
MHYQGTRWRDRPRHPLGAAASGLPALRAARCWPQRPAARRPPLFCSLSRLLAEARGRAPGALALARRAAPRLLLAFLAGLALYLLWQALPYVALLAAALAALRRRRRGGRSSFASALLGLLAAYLGLRRQGRSWGPSWHPCEQCGAPIDRPSRARYCSQACRRYARLRREAAAIADEVPF